MVVNAEVVEKLTVFLAEGRIEVSIMVDRDEVNGAKRCIGEWKFCLCFPCLIGRVLIDSVCMLCHDHLQLETLSDASSYDTR